VTSKGVPQHLFDLLTADLPNELKEHDECFRACQNVLNELASPEDIHAVCVHEAGHYVYAVKFGMIVGFKSEQIEMCPPRVEHYLDIWDNNRDRFQAVPGSIRTPFEAKKTQWTLLKIWNAAQVAVAGSVFAGKITNHPNKGIAGDKELFETYYRLAQPALHKNPRFLEYSEYWRDATNDVEKALAEYPVLESQATALAENYASNHFVPYLSYCDSKNADR
jgi:hypothetical protein